MCTSIHVATVPHVLNTRGWNVSHVYITRVWCVATCFMVHVAQWQRVFTVHVAKCAFLYTRIYHAVHVAIYTWLTVCHVYWLNTRGNLQVAKFNFFFFCSVCTFQYYSRLLKWVIQPVEKEWNLHECDANIQAMVGRLTNDANIQS
jgi:hypothetical protein